MDYSGVMGIWNDPLLVYKQELYDIILDVFCASIMESSQESTSNIVNVINGRFRNWIVDGDEIIYKSCKSYFQVAKEHSRATSIVPFNKNDAKRNNNDTKSLTTFDAELVKTIEILFDEGKSFTEITEQLDEAYGSKMNRKGDFVYKAYKRLEGAINGTTMKNSIHMVLRDVIVPSKDDMFLINLWKQVSKNIIMSESRDSDLFNFGNSLFLKKISIGIIYAVMLNSKRVESDNLPQLLIYGESGTGKSSMFITPMMKLRFGWQVGVDAAGVGRWAVLQSHITTILLDDVTEKFIDQKDNITAVRQTATGERYNAKKMGGMHENNPLWMVLTSNDDFEKMRGSIQKVTGANTKMPFERRFVWVEMSNIKELEIEFKSYTYDACVRFIHYMYEVACKNYDFLNMCDSCDFMNTYMKYARIIYEQTAEYFKPTDEQEILLSDQLSTAVCSDHCSNDVI